MVLYFLVQLSLFLLFFTRSRALRLSAVLAYVYSSLALLLAVLGLSFFNSVNSTNLLIYWAVLFGVSCLLLIKRKALSPSTFNLIETKITNFATNLSFVSKCQLLFILFIAVTTLFIGWKSPPNNHDAMTAHLARLIYWTQNQNINFYPTSELPQLTLGPYASYRLLNTFLLSGNDNFIHFVQWEAMVVTLIGVSLLASSFHFSKQKHIFTLFLVAALPMGILQASSAQNDYIVSVFMVLFFYFILQIVTSPSKENHYHDAVLAGITVGLAALTKATTYVYALGLAPLVLLFLFQRKEPFFLKRASYVVLILVIGVAINFYQFYQMQTTFGFFLGSLNENSMSYLNQGVSPKIFTENSLKNILLHINIRNRAFNLKANEVAKGVFTALHLNSNNPLNTWDTKDPFRIRRSLSDENYTGNMIHFALIVLSVGAFVALRATKKYQPNQNLLYLTFATFFSIILFLLIFKWQPWHSRLHLMYFILLSLFVADIWARHKTRELLVGVVTILIMIFSVTPALFMNVTKNIMANGIANLHNKRQYLASGHLFGYEQLLPISWRIQEVGCEKVYLSLSANQFEYPLWALTNFETTIEHYGPKNVTIQLVKNQPDPLTKNCHLISNKRRDFFTLESQIEYENAETFGGFTLFH